MSDWSSDVCSSDLRVWARYPRQRSRAWNHPDRLPRWRHRPSGKADKDQYGHGRHHDRREAHRPTGGYARRSVLPDRARLRICHVADDARQWRAVVVKLAHQTVTSFIDGAFIPSRGPALDVVNPADESLAGTQPEADAAEVAAPVHSAANDRQDT